jgi:hypothetical protein
MKEFVHSVNWLDLLKQWWVSLLLIPFVIYHIHQVYWTLRFNIFFSISYSFPFPVNLENFLVQNFLLIIHEAGHTFFGFLGNRTLTILGGSLNEILLPAIILAYFIFNKIIKGTQFGFYLLGSAWISVAFYAADGARRQLPLIANLGTESHDWGILLRQWNMVEQAGTFGIIFASIGIICFIIALSVPIWMKNYEEIDLDLSI